MGLGDLHGSGPVQKARALAVGLLEPRVGHERARVQIPRRAVAKRLLGDIAPVELHIPLVRRDGAGAHRDIEPFHATAVVAEARARELLHRLRGLGGLGERRELPATEQRLEVPPQPRPRREARIRHGGSLIGPERLALVEPLDAEEDVAVLRDDRDLPDLEPALLPEQDEVKIILRPFGVEAGLTLPDRHAEREGRLRVAPAISHRGELMRPVALPDKRHQVARPRDLEGDERGARVDLPGQGFEKQPIVPAEVPKIERKDLELFALHSHLHCHIFGKHSRNSFFEVR